MSQSTHMLSIQGTRLLLDGQPFCYQGLSFFNAIHNPTFNRSAEERLRWLKAFKSNGVNALRIWCQWDFEPPRHFADVAADCTMYTEEGRVRPERFGVLAAILIAMDSLEMVAEVVLFSHEKMHNLLVPAAASAARQMTALLKPYRNLIVQIWNEDSREVARYYHEIKAVDPERIATNSPGFAGNLGDDVQNRMLDLLTPHTARGEAERFWEIAPTQIAHLLEKYQKPVIDDEPARCGTVQFGGIQGGTQPWQHIEQIRHVRALGAYHVYHHDMFQTGYGSPAVPPSGIPEPDHSPFHRQVFDFLRDNRQW